MKVKDFRHQTCVQFRRRPQTLSAHLCYLKSIHIWQSQSSYHKLKIVLLATPKTTIQAKTDSDRGRHYPWLRG